jgi:predicted transposase YbfD/YdcC
VKDNQPRLRYQIEKAFTRDADKIKAYHEDISKGHGRIEQRWIEVIDMPWEYLNEWRHIKQICRITRDRSVKKRDGWKRKITVTYLITSLTEKEANPRKMLEINRGHCSIENGLHLVRDVAFDEDRHNLRHPKVTAVIVSVRDLLIHILDKLNQGYRAMREYFAAKPYLAIRLLFETYYVKLCAALGIRAGFFHGVKILLSMSSKARFRYCGDLNIRLCNERID